jgi:hypothetical protein
VEFRVFVFDLASDPRVVGLPFAVPTPNDNGRDKNNTNQ